MSVPVISYEPFERLVVFLRADGLAEDADRLDYMMHKVAWTTGSELVGELGQVISTLQREHRDQVSSKSRQQIDVALEMVARVWPDFPR